MVLTNVASMSWAGFRGSHRERAGGRLTAKSRCRGNGCLRRRGFLRRKGPLLGTHDPHVRPPGVGCDSTSCFPHSTHIPSHEPCSLLRTQSHRWPSAPLQNQRHLCAPDRFGREVRSPARRGSPRHHAQWEGAHSRAQRDLQTHNLSLLLRRSGPSARTLTRHRLRHDRRYDPPPHHQPEGGAFAARLSGRRGRHGEFQPTLSYPPQLADGRTGGMAESHGCDARDSRRGRRLLLQNPRL